MSISKVLVLAGTLSLMGISNSSAECKCTIGFNPVEDGYGNIYIVARNGSNEKWNALGPLSSGEIIRVGRPNGKWIRVQNSNYSIAFALGANVRCGSTTECESQHSYTDPDIPTPLSSK